MKDPSAPALAPSLPLRLRDVAYTFVAMAGWRVDHLNAPWVVAGTLSLAAGHALIRANRPAWTFTYWAFTLAFYYGGLTWLLSSGLPRRLIARLGERRAYRVYETVVALMFIHQGLGVGCVTALDLGPHALLPLSADSARALGAALFVTGLVVKVWASALLGVDTYYFRDLFVGRPLGAFVQRGPYRLFENPIYGVGQLHGYGYAVWHRSFAGFAAMAVCHMLIYVFYFTVEQPFVRKAYLGEVKGV